MSPDQLTALKNHINASVDPAVVTARGGGAIGRNDTELARLYNLASTFVVWRSSVPIDEYRAAMTWTEVDALTVGKARIWDWLTSGMTLPLAPATAAVRQGLADCWGAATATRAALLAASKRFATVAERIFVTGTGSNATPGDLVFEGSITITDIGSAFQN